MNLDFADVKPSLVSWVIVGLMAITFIVVAKFLTSRWPVKGLTEVIQSV
jgi:hypothetical protein